MKEIIRTILLDEVLKDEMGNVIAIKELINEITLNGVERECVTREVVKLENGRVVIDQVLYKSNVTNQEECQTVNFLMGMME